MEEFDISKPLVFTPVEKDYDGMVNTSGTFSVSNQFKFDKNERFNLNIEKDDRLKREIEKLGQQ